MLYFHSYKPKEIVEYMLVSDGIASRGLRNNIFNSNLKVMGVACGPHETKGSVTVVDFVSRELADGEMPTIEVEEVGEVPEEVKKQLSDMGYKGKVVVQSRTSAKVATKSKVITDSKAAKPSIVKYFNFLFDFHRVNRFRFLLKRGKLPEVCTLPGQIKDQQHQRLPKQNLM